jgi:hypothetical protein
LLGNGSANTPIARHTITATDTHAIMEEVFCVRSVLRPHNEDKLPLRDSLETAVTVGGWY